MTSRILDVDGAAWPVTGHRCFVCRMPADPVLNGDPHMFFIGPVPPLNPNEYGARIRPSPRSSAATSSPHARPTSGARPDSP
jgi:hypothetical protein